MDNHAPTPASDRGVSRAVAIALVSAALALGLLAWLLGRPHSLDRGPEWVGGLPALDAVCNGASALCAMAGFFAIRAGRRKVHKAFMLAALGFSAFFLAGYLIFHAFRGETRFVGTGAARWAYLALLASHILMSALVLPMLFVTVAFAGIGVFARHKALARWTLPLWIYVSVSGVAVFWALRASY